MSETDQAVIRFLDRLPEWARLEACKAIKAAQMQAFADGVAHAEQSTRLAQMASDRIMKHFEELMQ
jgi:hypothetical protein